jgi:hypothetical protein
MPGAASCDPTHVHPSRTHRVGPLDNGDAVNMSTLEYRSYPIIRDETRVGQNARMDTSTGERLCRRVTRRRSTIREPAAQEWKPANEEAATLVD